MGDDSKGHRHYDYLEWVIFTALNAVVQHDNATPNYRVVLPSLSNLSVEPMVFQGVRKDSFDHFPITIGGDTQANDPSRGREPFCLLSDHLRSIPEWSISLVPVSDDGHQFDQVIFQVKNVALTDLPEDRIDLGDGCFSNGATEVLNQSDLLKVAEINDSSLYNLRRIRPFLRPFVLSRNSRVIYAPAPINLSHHKLADVEIIGKKGTVPASVFFDLERYIPNDVQAPEAFVPVPDRDRVSGLDNELYHYQAFYTETALERMGMPRLFLAFDNKGVEVVTVPQEMVYEGVLVSPDVFSLYLKLSFLLDLVYSGQIRKDDFIIVRKTLSVLASLKIVTLDESDNLVITLPVLLDEERREYIVDDFNIIGEVSGSANRLFMGIVASYAAAYGIGDAMNNVFFHSGDNTTTHCWGAVDGKLSYDCLIISSISISQPWPDYDMPTKTLLTMLQAFKRSGTDVSGSLKTEVADKDTSVRVIRRRALLTAVAADDFTYGGYRTDGSSHHVAVHRIDSTHLCVYDTLAPLASQQLTMYPGDGIAISKTPNSVDQTPSVSEISSIAVPDDVHVAQTAIPNAVTQQVDTLDDIIAQGGE